MLSINNTGESVKSVAESKIEEWLDGWENVLNTGELGDKLGWPQQMNLQSSPLVRFIIPRQSVRTERTGDSSVVTTPFSRHQ